MRRDPALVAHETQVLVTLVSLLICRRLTVLDLALFITAIVDWIGKIDRMRVRVLFFVYYFEGGGNIKLRCQVALT